MATSDPRRKDRRPSSASEARNCRSARMRSALIDCAKAGTARSQRTKARRFVTGRIIVYWPLLALSRITMSAQLKTTTVDKHSEYNKPRMFFLSVVALLTAGVSFSMRTSIADDLKTIFFDPIDRAHSAEMLGSVLGVAFLG